MTESHTNRPDEKPVPKKASSSSKFKSGEKKKKKGKIKRIRGFLTGESRRERRARKAAERAAGKTVEDFPDDDQESVYGVDLDEQSQAMEATTPPRGKGLLGAGSSEEVEEIDDKDLPFMSPSPTAPALQVILLLMDPKTRRFELLQLEFDSDKALVSDVLAQIPLSVTEDQLRKQLYEGVCDRSGLEMIKTMRLSEFCTSNEVILAIPNGMASKECARLARPILSDEGVIAMLRASGIDASLPASPSEDATTRTPPIEEETEKSSSGGLKLTLIVTAVIVALLSAAHMYITAPLKPGQVLAPGYWMSKCGLLSPLPEEVCENSGLEMNEDGVLTLYGHDGSVQWRLVGGQCRSSDTDCEPGLVVQEDGNLVIGGKQITSVTIKGDAPLTPWPFEREPKLRVVRK